MAYQHIDNLYKNQDILKFKECYALEKIHGTSASVMEMVEDVYREGKGEIAENKDVEKAIGKKTAKMYQRRLGE